MFCIHFLIFGDLGVIYYYKVISLSEVGPQPRHSVYIKIVLSH